MSKGSQASPASNGSPWGAALIALGTLLAALYVVLSARFALAADAGYVVACQQSVALLFALLMLPLVHDAFTPDACVSRLLHTTKPAAPRPCPGA